MATWGELEKAGTKWRDHEEMTWGKLEEFCVINPKTKQIPDDMEVSFVPMQSVSETGDVQTDEVRKASEVKKGFTFFEEGDVLFAKITPCMENGKGGIARGLKNGVGFGSTEFHVLHPDPEKVSSEWLYYLTSWGEFRKQCARNMTGSAGQKRVPKSYLEHYKVHLPPLEEQRRIAALLDKVSDLIAKRRAQLDKLDLLVKARFVEMFGNFIYERNRWETCDVGTVADIIDPQPSHRTPPISENGVPYIGVTECDYKTLRIDFQKARKVGQNVLKEHLARYTVDEGDFIIGKIGTIGKPFFVPVKRNYTLSANTVLLKPMKNKVNSQFLFSVFQSEYMDRIIDEEKKSTSQPAFGIQKIRKIEIPLPPLKLQEDFAFFVRQCNKSKLTIQQSHNKLEILKKALMQQYFG